MRAIISPESHSSQKSRSHFSHAAKKHGTYGSYESHVRAIISPESHSSQKSHSRPTPKIGHDIQYAQQTAADVRASAGCGGLPGFPGFPRKMCHAPFVFGRGRG